MSKTEFPFANFDFNKLFDPSKMFDAQKMFGDFKLPGFDAEALAATQKKNLEAIAAANKKAFEGYQALAARQAEIFQQGMDELSSLVKDAVSKGAKDANPAKQAELVKAAVERALANLKELAELAAKTNTETFETLNKRANESLEELRATLSKLVKQ
ncbi:phasin family protein [Ferrovibrio sp.]|uniref:phasin family protein n=1 Tax=Ferrovibrio sp. TaxID=1917215 RepID=UPI0025BC9FA9|nr:TIGR01841 family phasin [Ferrovibrio sp.]MBX3455088.1 TIGR01841 family phasin [Ferrovibrio sp.]